MATTHLNIRLDKDVKTQAEILFSELGLNMTSAITVFLKAAIREQGIPFPLRLETPADITLAAVEEGGDFWQTLVRRAIPTWKT